MRVIGGRDTQIQLLAAATEALSCLYKARKWFLTRGDYNYAALWILAAATPMARMEVMRHGQLSDREVLPRALPLNPELFSVIYTGMLNEPKDRDAVERALTMAESHLLAGARICGTGGAVAGRSDRGSLMHRDRCAFCSHDGHRAREWHV